MTGAQSSSDIPSAPTAEPLLASHVLMIRPSHFGYNAQTAPSNAFQREPGADEADRIFDDALREFDGFAQLLTDHGVRVTVARDDPSVFTPDAIFPNNWISFHADGSVVLYPMLTPNRRDEVRPDLIDLVERETGWRWPRLVDLTPLANPPHLGFLEGTGSLVLDRRTRTAFACRSPRTTALGLDEFTKRMAYTPCDFLATDNAGAPIYHTNVMMALGETCAIVCAESIPDPAQRAALLDRLACAGHEPIIISRGQMANFAANALALRSQSAGPIIALSARALSTLDPAQIRALERAGSIIAPSLTTIESIGGGSARCMLAEVHQPSPQSAEAHAEAPSQPTS